MTPNTTNLQDLTITSLGQYLSILGQKHPTFLFDPNKFERFTDNNILNIILNVDIQLSEYLTQHPNTQEV